jgi:hypothetical protein
MHLRSGVSRTLPVLVVLSAILGYVARPVAQTASVRPSLEAATWQCAAKPIEPCAVRHGRLSSQNGIGLKIWLIGTNRVVALENPYDGLPSHVRRYLSMTSPDHSYIYGDFNLCPLEPDRPGHIRRACAAGAEKLVVQNLRGSRPAFRLLSTWPPAARADQRQK